VVNGFEYILYIYIYILHAKVMNKVSIIVQKYDMQLNTDIQLRHKHLIKCNLYHYEDRNTVGGFECNILY
jgi:hypothetical protein